jgi:hypothetical protein
MNVTQLACLAAKAFLASESLTTISNIYTEEEDTDVDDGSGNTVQNFLTRPCVRLTCENAKETPMFTGNYNLDLHCMVEAKKDDTTQAQFMAMVTEVFEAIHTSTLPADLSEYDGFTCFGIADEVSQSTGADSEARTRQHTLIIPIYCCPSNIS